VASPRVPAESVVADRPAETLSVRLREAGVVVALASLLTVVMAWPVLLSPSTRLFGVESVGRHPDPFIVMQQYETGHVPRPYLLATVCRRPQA
jgi:hypothetical protein